MINWGEVVAGTVLPFPFDAFALATGAPITMTNFAVGDVLIYKGTSMTQRSSTAGVVLMDTDGVDLDGTTGIHGFSIDTGDNTDAGFYATGSYFWVVVTPVTIDSVTMSFVAGTFRLKAAENTAGVPVVDTVRISNTVQTARDIGASVLLSSGTGTGQIKIASGYVAMTWADIAAPTTTVNLSGTTIKTATDVETDTAEIGAAGAGLTNINLPNQTMDIVGNITGNLSGSVGSVTGAVGSVTGAVGSVTGNVGGNVTGSVGSVVGAVGSVTGNVGGNVVGSVASVTAEVTANAVKISGSTTAADNLKESTEVIGTGTCDAGGTTTSIVASAITPASAVNDQFVGRILIFKGNVTGALAGQATDITDYVHATLTMTVTALTTAPASGDLFVVV